MSEKLEDISSLQESPKDTTAIPQLRKVAVQRPAASQVIQVTKPVVRKFGDQLVPEATSLLVVLQFWWGEVRSGRLEKLLTVFARSPAFRNGRAKLVLAPRADTDLPAFAKAPIFAQQFPGVQVFRGSSAASGWPAGCNELFRDTIRQVAHANVEQRVMLLTEVDTIPLRIDWVDRLLAVWNQSKPAKCVGAFKEARDALGDLVPHINGNMLLSTNPDFLFALAKNPVPQNRAWDVYLYPFIEPHGAKPTDAIINEWRKPTIANDELETILKSEAVLHHGVKDESLLNWALERLT